MTDAALTRDDVLLWLNDHLGATVDLTVRTTTDERELAGAYRELHSAVGEVIDAGEDPRDAINAAEWDEHVAYSVGDAWFAVPVADVEARERPERPHEGVAFNVAGESVETVVRWLESPDD
jgi:hypothetical protein